MNINTNSKLLNHIQFSGIEKCYGRKKYLKRIIKNIDITLSGGECVLLTGKNGSGKSTLLRIMAGLLKPDTATINTGLQSLSWKQARKMIRKQVMYFYQEPYMFDGSVHLNLSYATNGTNSAKRISKVLKWAGLEHREYTEAKCLSGGEKQRVALAQAWLRQPNILLLDEPTANMDDSSRRSTEKLLCKFKESGTALLIASHDLNHFYHAMDKRLALVDGKLFDIDDEVNQKLLENNDIAMNNEALADNISLFPNKFSNK